MTRRLLAFMIAAAVAVVACPGPTFVVQQYTGPVRPASAVAILRVNGGESVRLLFLDDEDVAAPIASDGRLHIEMLPGRHTLIVRNGDDQEAPRGSLAFVAEPGKVYRVAFTGDEPRIFEVDRGSDRPVADVTKPQIADEGDAGTPDGVP